MGEIGSGFVRVPSLGLNKGEPAKDEQQVHYPPRPFVPYNTDPKAVGQRAAKGISRIGKAAFRSLMIFTAGMAQGAHNLPKVWGDKTVRPQDKITGLGSGLKAAVNVRISMAIVFLWDPYPLLLQLVLFMGFFFLTLDSSYFQAVCDTILLTIVESPGIDLRNL